jgi:hypothetical protein
MASAQQKPAVLLPAAPGRLISPAESARYTAEMLETLRKIALQQGQPMLAHLLELAQAEARILFRVPDPPVSAPPPDAVMPS